MGSVGGRMEYRCQLATPIELFGVGVAARATDGGPIAQAAHVVWRVAGRGHQTHGPRPALAMWLGRLLRL